ncbi:MAG: CBS domain-containing protein [Acidimicrobiia bacterium]|nr:CBS domain-containing protein [Acidimicrobiia bacterium]
MTHWRHTLLRGTAPLAEAIRIIDVSSKQICLVVDGADRLLGTVTDGDIRRAILKAVPLDAPVERVMNRAPTTLAPEYAREDAVQLMRSKQLHQLPVVDADRRVVGLVLIDDLMEEGQRADNWVVLMAGGLGARLRPLTETVPKPMLKVGVKPLLETTLESFAQQGFHRFYISVNYLAGKVKGYFGDGARWGCEIRYLEEKEQLGTAGALGLLPERPEKPLIVMNGDVLTKVNFGHLLDFHREHKAAATMCVREYDFRVPYGVVQLEGARINGLVEKPVHSFFVNAGIYVVEPTLLDDVPRDGRQFHMTHLFENALAAGRETAAFPIREYWIDIGQIDDLARANGDYRGLFE